MRVLAVFVVVVFLAVSGFVGHALYRGYTSDVRAKELISGLMCDPILDRQLVRDYGADGKKRSTVDKRPGRAWMWTVNRASSLLIEQKVNPSTLKEMFGRDGENFPHVDDQVRERMRDRCGASGKPHPLRRFKIALVWEVVFSYANVPSPVRCLRCMLPRKPLRLSFDRSAMMRRMRQAMWGLSTREKAEIDIDAKDYVRSRTWIYKRIYKASKAERLDWLLAIGKYDGLLRKDPFDMKARVKRAQAYLAVGRYLDATRELKIVVAMCGKRILRSRRDIDAYFYRALAHAGLTEYEKASNDMDVAAQLARHRKQARTSSYYRAMSREFQLNQKTLDYVKRL